MCAPCIVPDMRFSHSIHCKLYTIIGAHCTDSRMRIASPVSKVSHLVAGKPYECTMSTDVIVWFFGTIFTLPLLYGCWSCDHLNSVHQTPYEAHMVHFQSMNEENLNDFTEQWIRFCSCIVADERQTGCNPLRARFETADSCECLHNFDSIPKNPAFFCNHFQLYLNTPFITCEREKT